MTVGSLFAGIGGFDLGFERAGFEIKWQVEIDEYCQRVLAKHWPHVRRYGDIRAIDWSRVEPVDVVCGGFPCQPHSLAGKRAGASDERDLWPEFRRCIRGVKPGWIVAENVSGLLSNDAGRFFGGVLRDLAEGGRSVEWDCIPASAVGTDHIRDRVWILAHAGRERSSERMHEAVIGGISTEDTQARRSPDGVHASTDATYSERGERSLGRPAGRVRRFGQSFPRHGRWEITSEPVLGRGEDGIPNRLDRLRGLGNAVMPQIPEWIAHRIKEAEGLTA